MLFDIHVGAASKWWASMTVCSFVMLWHHLVVALYSVVTDLCFPQMTGWCIHPLIQKLHIFWSHMRYKFYTLLFLRAQKRFSFNSDSGRISGRLPDTLCRFDGEPTSGLYWFSGEIVLAYLSWQEGQRPRLQNTIRAFYFLMTGADVVSLDQFGGAGLTKGLESTSSGWRAGCQLTEPPRCALVKCCD